MILELLPQAFTVCKCTDRHCIPVGEFLFYSVTDQEISLVCPTPLVPSSATAREDGFRAFRIVGPLPFSMTGVLAGISSVLADAGVAIFAVSTYDTDYLFVRESQLPTAQKHLSDANYSWRTRNT